MNIEGIKLRNIYPMLAERVLGEDVSDENERLLDEVLAILGINLETVPRFRALFFDGKYLVIKTRTGGWNRRDYREQNYYMMGNKDYAFDHDCAFDSTYAFFYFYVPDEYKSKLRNEKYMFSLISNLLAKKGDIKPKVYRRARRIKAKTERRRIRLGLER